LEYCRSIELEMPVLGIVTALAHERKAQFAAKTTKIALKTP
jgi:hypothetical protein